MLELYRPYVERTVVSFETQASIALHRTVGFEPIGVFRRVGRKFGAWQDVAWLHRPLREEPLFPGDHRASPEGTSIDV